MANVTRIKASDPGKSKQPAETGEPKTVTKLVAKAQVSNDKKTAKATGAAGGKKSVNKESRNEGRKASKKAKQDTGKKPFILLRPFVALGHYLRDSWREIRQVRWPNRKATWKMVLAVLVYTAIFMILISLLDLFFTWLFSLILGN